VEEERRLAFVGMTRAKQELYVCHARMREFRGETLYAVPSMFLEELPKEPVQWVDLSASAGGTRAAMEAWRGGGSAAQQGWTDAGVRPLPPPIAPQQPASGFAEGMLVRHQTYGVGRVVELSGHGALRKVKVRFGSGERTFIADKAALEVVRKA
jgi:DNA helicase-2/ATP-dependent DNA helicase PcrA